MGVMVVACYRPKPGKEETLRDLVATHLPALRKEGLVGGGPSLCGCAGDGTIIEAFVWKSQEAIDAAHENRAVKALWEKFGEACDYVAIADVPEARHMFSEFTPVELAK